MIVKPVAFNKTGMSEALLQLSFQDNKGRELWQGSFRYAPTKGDEPAYTILPIIPGTASLYSVDLDIAWQLASQDVQDAIDEFDGQNDILASEHTLCVAPCVVRQAVLF